MHDLLKYIYALGGSIILVVLLGAIIWFCTKYSVLYFLALL